LATPVPVILSPAEPPRTTSTDATSSCSPASPSSRPASVPAGPLPIVTDSGAVRSE
jgi:hypothetical protein